MSDAIKSDPVPDMQFEATQGVFGPAAGMEDIEVVFSDTPLPNESSDPYAGMSQGDLAAKLREDQARLKQLEEQANMNAALSQSISQLGMNLNRPHVEDVDPIQASLKQIQGDPSAQQQSFFQKKADETEAEYKTRLQEEFYNDPLKMNDAMFSSKVAPLMTQMMTMNLTHARRSIEYDTDRKDTYKKYRGEIDRLVAEMDPRMKFQDSTIFEKAHDQIVARHINEIIQDKVKEALATNQQPQYQQTAQPPSSPSFMETQSTPVRSTQTQTQGKRTVRLSKAEEEYCKMKGLHPNDYYRWKYGGGQ